jgi:DNA-binding transcriptional LysR family regulator
MELRHLRYFIAVAETENVSSAALKLHVSQPGLSRQIRDLEDELGFLLFERGAKSLRLTDAGRSFLKESRAVLQRAEDAVKAARAVATRTSAELNVGYAMSPTIQILPPALRAFKEAQPGVRVKLHDMSTGEMLAGLRRGKIHIAFMVMPGASMMRGFRTEELARMGMCLAVAHHHPLSRRRTVTIAEIARHPLVVYSRADYPEYYEFLKALFASAKVKLRITEEHDSVASLIAALESGNGVALVSETIACISGPRLKLIPITPAPEPIVIVAAWQENGLSPEAEKFLQCARETVGRK